MRCQDARGSGSLRSAAVASDGIRYRLSALAELLPSERRKQILSHRDSVEDAGLGSVRDQSLERRVGVRSLFFEPPFD
jgi:hypothetical protein